ncbi:MAG TPA: hypothetical protein VNW06_04390 [Cytophagaceae bacterium]|jgi:hypothetical protein|nr:hypothetical protein [Cytophagaceae bacterium]
MIQKTHISPELSQQLEILLSYCSPDSLRKTIEHFYFSYTMNESNLGVLPDDFHEKSSDIYFLLEFLNAVEEHLNKKSTKSISE